MKIVEFARQRVDEWRAQDGGMTHAATDAIGFGKDVQRLYDAGDFEAIKGIDFFDLGSAESDILEYAMEHIPTEE